MANTFEPRKAENSDIYVYEDQKSDLVGKLGSTAIAVSSLISAFAFLSPAASITSSPEVNLGGSTESDPGVTQATDPGTATNAANPVKGTVSNHVSTAGVRPRFVAIGHNAGSGSHNVVVSNPASPSATPAQTYDPNASIGGVAQGTSGNTSSSTAAAGGTAANAGGTTGNTSSSTAASGATGGTASGTNAGGVRNNHENDDHDH